METESKDIGQRIKQYRKEMKLTQAQLGKMIGKTESSIRKYESGLVNDIPNSVLQQIAEALNVPWIKLVHFDVYNNSRDKLDKLSSVNKNTDIYFSNIESRLKNLDDNIQQSIEQAFINLLSELNDNGLEEAYKRVKELTQLEEYTRR
jgi:transcriptional regulator with XRE-family HTH domain